jgi:serine/threonine protein kinase
VPRELPVALQAAQEAFGTQYDIEHQIGRGAAAVVFFGRARNDGRTVAIKVLRPELGASLYAGLFHREVRILASLDHPNILPMLACHDADDLLAYVMPYATGGSLRDRLSRHGRFTLAETLGIVRQLAAALDHAHALGVVHRDVKPENVLFDGGIALLCDFGLARAIQRASKDGPTTSRLLLGTPEYMSPEQIAGKRGRLNHRSDVYSLGCVTYEMLVGEPPFTGKSFRHIIAKHAKEPPPRISIVRPELGHAVDRTLRAALAKRPKERPATAGEFVEALAVGG